jgi:plasmid stability protein
MANLTISIEDELLKRARVRAAAEGTSVNAVLRAYLEEWTTRRQVYRDAGDDFLRIVGEGKAGSCGNRWTRDELHDR